MNNTTTFRIETQAIEGPSAGVWEMEPNGGGFATREEAEVAVEALVETLGYERDRVRIVEEAGYLCDHKTGERVRRATAEERAESRAAAERDGGAGVIDVDGRRCYVED